MEQAAGTVRLFFALWPPKDLQAGLAAWARQAAGSGRAMRSENIHLTLAFLGAVDAALVPDLTALAAGVRFAAFRLRLDRVGYWKHKRIVWCGAAQDPEALGALVGSLRGRLCAAGMRYDPRPFVSHVTLVREASGISAAPPWIPLLWEAGDFALVRSARVEGRLSYQPLQRFPAAGN
ncbi:MAG: RNA 2',3'-cyclic phosphodiesterase [Burkholderiales bacterium]|nr:RNA 2',3'-cyclic phosphodiesterase [Burkholderiales bacterium]